MSQPLGTAAPFVATSLTSFPTATSPSLVSSSSPTAQVTFAANSTYVAGQITWTDKSGSVALGQTITLSYLGGTETAVPIVCLTPCNQASASAPLVATATVTTFTITSTIAQPAPSLVFYYLIICIDTSSNISSSPQLASQLSAPILLSNAAAQTQAVGK